MPKGKPKMPMMRLKDEDYEKLEEMAVEETARQQRIVPVSEMLKLVIDKAYQRFTTQYKKVAKPADEDVKKDSE